jgi:thiosulfate/3-mercaptopyruvate sulfurtransferase
MRYLSGHLPGAINAPATGALDERGRLRADDDLASWLASSGVGTDLPVVLYDGYDGQLGSLMAWVLEYLGHPDVRFLRTSFEAWKGSGRPVKYRPVEGKPATFAPRLRPAVRAGRPDVAGATGTLLDVRSEAEYTGEAPGDLPPGHIPGAVSVPWLEFVGKEGNLFVSRREALSLLRDSGVNPEDDIITYCRTGPRAAVAWLALLHAGLQVRLYDGSFMDWTSEADAPVES